eukprot:7975932-Pyramimonas_sp.AAC.1
MGPPGYFWKQGPIRDAIADLDLQGMRSVSATSASASTALTRCPPDHICMCMLRVRASPPTYGDARAL